MNAIKQKMPSWQSLHILHLIRCNGALTAYELEVPKSAVDRLWNRNMIYAVQYAYANTGHGRRGIKYGITQKGLDTIHNIPYVALSDKEEYDLWLSRA